jgi:hypothetical protein
MYLKCMGDTFKYVSKGGNNAWQRGIEPAISCGMHSGERLAERGAFFRGSGAALENLQELPDNHGR